MLKEKTMLSHTSRLFDMLEYQLLTFPQEDMLASKQPDGQWKKYSTQDVVNLVNRFSAGLMKLGLGKKGATVEAQDKIALISKNRPEWLLLDLACQQIGVILCPVYPTSNVLELEFIFNDAEVQYVFVSGEDLYNKVAGLKNEVASIKDIIAFDRLEGVPYWENYLSDEYVEEVAVAKKNIDPEACATIIYTSGTTGTPKGVMLSHRNIVTNVLNSKISFPFDDQPGTKALSFLPLNHIFERMVTYIYICSGICIYYAESLETIGDNLKEVKPNVFCTVPRLLEKVYEKIMIKGQELTGIKRKLFFWAISLAEVYDNRKSGGMMYNMQLAIANKLIFSKWREALGNNIQYIITGGAACQERLLRIFNGARIPIYEGYGPTENSPVISVNRQEKDGTHFGSVGPILHGQEVRLEADGEICVKGPSVMMGYYKRPDLTAEVIQDGWLHTGDIGVYVENKYLKITDRKKELFKTSGGKYVAPQPIENKMKESPYVEQMMVVGADKKFVAALIVPSFTTLRDWMQTNQIPYTDHEAAVKHPEVLKMYRALVESFNTFFNPVEQIKKFELIPHEWTIETGELTPTLKLKRKVIMEKHRDSIERIYA
ncbi:MAG TPA: long-chain fatty acid--CoA ligase [Ferruginibacter sp.]|nr:long-chain fatty acid--CoA ligase [Ferruginibacter sp.]HRQ19834.1 long-chain fatty acid--CoA ligase [Ferruginibacter sp.]